jgi:hypothetical protein
MSETTITIDYPTVTFAVGEGPDDRRVLTLTGYEKRIERFVHEHRAFFIRQGRDVPGPSKIKRLAWRLAKEQARTYDEDLWRVFNIPDPTAEQAIRNLEAAS